MRKIFTTLFWVMFLSGPGLMAQVTFTNQGNLLQAMSGFSYADCAVDMNGDQLDDVVRVDGDDLYIDYQQPDGSFVGVVYNVGFSNVPSWSICAADIDGNGFTDLLFGDGNAVSFVYANDTGDGYYEDPQPEYIFSQRSTFSDVDNDGNLDAFVCHDVDQCRPYRNVNGVLSYDASLIETLDVGGNYAAIWVDYDNDGDSDLYITKCRGGAPAGDPQRINLLYRNDGNGTFTSVGPEANMNDGDQSWATVFEDFDNDGDFDSFTVNHEWANRLMENNGDGTFTDVILSSNIDEGDLGAWNCDAGDFDNDGFVDIFSEMSTEMYWNNGDWTFTSANLTFNSGGIGDLNNDGFLDVINGNQLWINDGNDNHYIKFDLDGIVSNKDAIGARIEIYGDWGIQIREIRAGESFDPAGSLIAHFGIGTSTSVTQAIVKWPSGMVTVLENPGIDQTHIIPEVGCMLEPNTITVNGNTNICPGETVDLLAENGYGYTWSNGETTQSITVASPGVYSVIIWDELGCASLSGLVIVSEINEEQPVISIVGETLFCEGESAVLTSSIGDDYMWSNGQEGQTIVVEESGTYSVNISGVCSGISLTSEPVEITVLPSPVPVAEDVIIGEPGTAILTATGNNLTWYFTEDGTTVYGTGNSIETTFFNNQISYWVEGTTTHGGEMEAGGKPDNTGGGGLPASGGRLFFDVYEGFTLLSVTVYIPAEGVAGNRTIQLFDNTGVLANESVFNLSIGTNVIDLNWWIDPANGWSIGCAENNLFRNNAGLAYPYAIGTSGSIYDSTNGTSYYYYFYDWQIQKEEIVCISDRIEVTATVVGISEIAKNADLNVYPNPAEDVFNFIFEAQGVQRIEVSILNAFGQVVYTSMLNPGVSVTGRIDVGDFAAGVYAFRLNLDGETVMKEIVIE